MDSFDFESHPAWKNIDTSIAKNEADLLRMKRKFYKKHIDQNATFEDSPSPSSSSSPPPPPSSSSPSSSSTSTSGSSSNSSSSSSSSPSSNASASNSGGRSPSPSFFQKYGSFIELGLTSAILANGILSLIPISPVLAFRGSRNTMLFGFLFGIYRLISFSIPELRRQGLDWKTVLQRLYFDHFAQYTLLSLLFFMAAPGFLYATILVGINAFVYFILSLPCLEQTKARPIYTFLGKYTNPFIHRLDQIGSYLGLFEVLMLVFLMFSVLLGSASILVAVSYVMWIRIRYASSRFTKIGFAQVKLMFDKLFYSRFCPTFLASLWEKMKSGIQSMALQQQPVAT